MHAIDVARAGAGPGDEFTWDISHWPMHVAAVLTVAAAALVAALWQPGRVLLATSTCLAGLALGLASLLRPEAYAALPGRLPAAVVVLWSVAIGALALHGRALRPRVAAGRVPVGLEPGHDLVADRLPEFPPGAARLDLHGPAAPGPTSAAASSWAGTLADEPAPTGPVATGRPGAAGTPSTSPRASAPGARSRRMPAAA